MRHGDEPSVGCLLMLFGVIVGIWIGVYLAGRSWRYQARKAGVMSATVADDGEVIYEWVQQPSKEQQ